LASRLEDGADAKQFSQIYTVSQDGALFVWRYLPKPDITNDFESPGSGETHPQWRVNERHYFNQSNARVRCAAYHIQSNLIVAGFSNGIFGLYELPGFNMIHTLRSIKCDNVVERKG
jgi:periodic tryptophan protein 2